MSGDNGSGEEPQGGLSRAQLIRRAGVLGAAAALPATTAPALAGAASTADTPPAEVGGTSALKALTAAEAATLEALLERLLPSGAAGPGAKEANVLRYIDWSLAGDLSVFHPPYSAALAAVEVFSTQTYGGAFTAILPAQQDALIARMATGAEKPPAGTAPFLGFSPNSASVFTMIRTHALQGMFGDPMHGGNVGLVGWKLVRFPGPRLIISKQDQEIGATPKEYLQSAYTYKLFKNTTRRP